MPATLDPPTAASIDNPLYYLSNIRTAIHWVKALHGDLLTARELNRLQDFDALSEPEQALLVRLLMRTHNEFRVGSLHYPEIASSLAPMLTTLVQEKWLTLQPSIGVTELARLFKKAELQAAFGPIFNNLELTKNASKQTLITVLKEQIGEVRHPLTTWWPDCTDEVVLFTEDALFRRLRLMFFGNLRQDWSEFVITSLGYQAYEKVPLSKNSRAFQHRSEVDIYLTLFDFRLALDECEDVEELMAQIPPPPDNNWLQHRYCRLLFSLGHKAEREGNIALALDAYRKSWNRESRIRYFRLQEKHGEPQATVIALNKQRQKASSESEQESLHRIAHRLARKLNEPSPRQPPKAAVQECQLALPRDSGLSVEVQVAHALSDHESQCFYVENHLFNGLLTLLFWRAIYSPVPGAFFHPFQSAPADLFREDFAVKRQNLLTQSLAQLGSGSYREQIINVWHSRFGVSCPLFSWQVLTQELLQLSLPCIPHNHLEAIFKRQLNDLTTYRRGLPDLIRLWPAECRYQLIEVKAPGDRLQDHQRHWFHFFSEQGIPAQVCQVTWINESC